MVAMCNTRFKHSEIQNFFTQSALLCFVLISEQTVIIPMYTALMNVFYITEECVYCAVGAEYL